MPVSLQKRASRLDLLQTSLPFIGSKRRARASSAVTRTVSASTEESTVDMTEDEDIHVVSAKESTDAVDLDTTEDEDIYASASEMMVGYSLKI